MSLVFPHTFVPWFRSVAPYIHAYRGETFVVGMPGELVAAHKLNAFVQDLSILHAMGIKIVLVHGFRPQVDEQLKAKGHSSHYSHGVRITDEVALDAAIAQCTSLGGTVLMPPMEVPGVGRMAALADPQGAAFSVIKYVDQPS